METLQKLNVILMVLHGLGDIERELALIEQFNSILFNDKGQTNLFCDTEQHPNDMPMLKM